MTAATKSLHELNGQISAAPTVSMMGTGCGMVEPVPSLHWNWHSGMRDLPLHANLPQYIPLEALCAHAEGECAAPPAKPPGDFPYQECTPRTLAKHSPSVERPVEIGTGGDQLLPSENAAKEAAPMPHPLLRRTLTDVPQQVSSEMLPLRRALTTGTCSLLSSKVQMSEDAESGATLAVFSVHANHIVNSTSRQWVSDPFLLNMQGAAVEFRVQFIAKQVGESMRGLSFKRAKGLGKMELKCVGEPPEGNPFRIAFLAGPGVRHSSLGNHSGTITTTTAATTSDVAGGMEATTTSATGEAARRMTRREAQCSHDFSKYPTVGLTGKDEFWDFSSLVDKKKHIVFIGIEMLPQSDAIKNKPNLEQAQICSSEMDVPGDSHTIWHTSNPDDAEQFQEKQFRIRQLAKAATLGPPPGLELIGLGPPGLELIGPPLSMVV